MNNDELRNRVLGIADYTRPTQRQREVYMEAVLRAEEERERMQAKIPKSAERPHLAPGLRGFDGKPMYRTREERLWMEEEK